ncbi:MAG TPA: ATP-binding protein [Steroidobacteraceae bacterium]|nr:ATP-binding protein [Steroidobacteraceae bacterium]
MSSLRNTLLAWLLGAVAVVGAAGSWFSYRSALDEANAFFDYQLREAAMLLRDQFFGFQPPTALPQEVPAYDFVVQVWTFEGVRIYQSRPHTVLPGLTQIGLSTVETPAGRWRVYGVTVGRHVIQVAQPLDVRERRAATLALRTMQPFAVLMPALALLIVWVVRRSVRPMREFSLALSTRKPDSLEPLPDTRLPDELQPVASSLNELLARLRDAVGRERAFVADAAHELRTPLTALTLQAQEVAQLPSGPEREAAVGQLRAGVERVARLVEQLLALAREERAGAREHAPVDLLELAREVVGEMLPLADARHVDLGVETATSASVRGEREALRLLVRNVIDNAVRYSPEGGSVDVAIESVGDPARVELTVTDAGPGIPAAERDRVFDRFYRLPGTPVAGSGIGLALVRSIASHHGANVRLEDGPDGRGLRVRISFPAP